MNGNIITEKENYYMYYSLDGQEEGISYTKKDFT